MNKNCAAQLERLDFKSFLEREPAPIDSGPIREAVKDKRVLVTGAGGSIGSQICKQILEFNPASLALLDKDGPKLSTVISRLEDFNSDSKTLPAIGDITDEEYLEKLIMALRPDIVFHAAAYKSVPEGQEDAAGFILNNIFGTIRLIHACDKNRVAKFVFISTDKAVEPVSIMGATKRAGEEFIRSFAGQSKTSFVIVRFGNVLSSSGSVTEIFKEQIRLHRPLTVASENTKRFFMTVEEAVTLSLSAACKDKNTQIYLLDMGRPIRIMDLAFFMLRSSRINPSFGGSIIISGLRQGDKIEEKLFSPQEKVTRDNNDRLLMVDPKNKPQDYGKFTDWLHRMSLVLEGNNFEIRDRAEKLFAEIIPDYLVYEEYLKTINQESLT